MLPQQLDHGKAWIESELRATFGARRTTIVDHLSWRLDFASQRCMLDARVNGEQKRWIFSYKDVAECSASREAQRSIRWQLRFQ